MGTCVLKTGLLLIKILRQKLICSIKKAINIAFYHKTCLLSVCFLK